MKKNKYQIYTEIKDRIFLYFNSFSLKYLLLDQAKHELYQSHSADELEKLHPALYKKMCENQFLVPDDFDEQSIVEYKKICAKMDTTMYHIVVNMTLDCNLKCWYCYETKLHNSQLRVDVLHAIKENIELRYKQVRFKTLKISFFGGEPFLNFRGIKEILDFSDSFCTKNDISLLADFTTNATVIKPDFIEYLKKFTCCFQITLDGNANKHNEVKHLKGIDTFRLTINTIHRISQNIPNSYIWIRINYDGETLDRIDEILKDLDDLDRRRNFLILRRVWQTDAKVVSSLQLTKAIQHILDHNFFVDCYALSRNGVCFAERFNQVLFNFDGKVFKCSTLSSFDEKNSMGSFDLETGEVVWDLNKISFIPRIMTNNKCGNCPLFPSCLGPCNKNLIKSSNRTCIIDEMNLSMNEYLMYNFKLSLLYEDFSNLHL